MKKAEIIKNGHLTLNDISLQGKEKLGLGKITTVDTLIQEIEHLKAKIAKLEAENAELQEDNDNLRANRTG